MPNPKINALRSLVDASFPTSVRRGGGSVSTGVRAIDEALGGGLPQGRFTELVSEAAGTGGQLTLCSLLQATRQSRQRVALIDGADGFSPESVPRDALRHLVWIRPGSLTETFAAADVIVRDGNYAAVVIDLRGMEERSLFNAPKAQWHRLQRAGETRTAAILVQTTRGLVPAVPWRLTLRTPHGLTCRRKITAELLGSLTVEIVRGHQTYEEMAG